MHPAMRLMDQACDFSLRDLGAAVIGQSLLAALFGYDSLSATPQRGVLVIRSLTLAASALALSVSPTLASSPKPILIQSGPQQQVKNTDSLDLSRVTDIPQRLPTVAALRANNSSGFTAHVVVAGYYAAGDLGGGEFTVDSTDTTSMDNGGTVIVDAANRRWKRVNAGGFLTPQMFGAKCDNATDDAAKFTSLFAAANRPERNIIRLVAGQCVLNSGGFNITQPLTLEGPTGAIQSGGPAYAGLVVNFATGTLFNITHSQANTFRNFGIRASITRIAGNDFLLTGDSTNLPIGTVWDGVTFNGSFTPINIPNGKHWTVKSCGFYNYGYNGAGTAIYYPSNANPDSGDNTIIGNSFVSGVSGKTNHAFAAIYLESTFAVFVNSNKFFGGEYGIEVNVKDTSGNLLVNGNSFEQQGSSHIDIRQGLAGKSIGNIIIVGNEFSQLNSVTPSVNWSAPTIYFQAGTAAYILNAVISSNVFNDQGTNTVAVITLNDGIGTIVQGNVFNLYSDTHPWTFQGGGNAANTQLIDNIFSGQTSSQHYKHLTSSGFLVRDSGLQFADLSTWANGSQVYCTNCNAGPTLTGAGTGAWGRRINGAWNGN